MIKLIKRYGYRSARLVGEYETVAREFVTQLEDRLAAEAGKSKDNHTIYTFTDSDGKKWGVFFDDFKAHFVQAPFEIKEGIW